MSLQGACPERGLASSWTASRSRLWGCCSRSCDLGEGLHLPVPQFLHLQGGGNNNPPPPWAAVETEGKCLQDAGGAPCGGSGSLNSDFYPLSLT